MVELYPPQKIAVDKLLSALKRYGCAGNWSSTGCGKTLMGLAVARELGLQPLAVAPIAASATWEWWANELGLPLVAVVNPERLRTGKTPWVSVETQGKQRLFRWNLDRDRHIVLWDEIHRGLLGFKSQTGAMAAMLRPQGRKTLLMSATPFTSPLDFRASGYLLKAHSFSAPSFWDFCRRHGCRPSHFHRGLDFDPEARSAKEHLRRINEFLQDRTVCLTVEDLKEQFGECVVEPTLIKLEERDRAEIEAVYAEMEEEVKKKGHANPLVDMLRARQRAELLSVPAIADMVEDSVNEGNSVYVAQSFKDSVWKLQDRLRDRIDIREIRVLTGDDRPECRTESVEAFQSDRAKVLIATLGAGGLSISLHRTKPEQRPRTSILRPTYKADELLQGGGRIYRSGGIGSVLQRVPLLAGTIEERVYRRLQQKLACISTLTDSDFGL